MEREVSDPSPLKGYRNKWNNLRATYGINVSRDEVMEMLRNIEQVNSALRKARELRTMLQFAQPRL